eukprot:SAG31_NODE_4974_length_2824_cov_1.164771_3_plen_166_part_00
MIRLIRRPKTLRRPEPWNISKPSKLLRQAVYQCEFAEETSVLPADNMCCARCRGNRSQMVLCAYECIKAGFLHMQVTERHCWKKTMVAKNNVDGDRIDPKRMPLLLGWDKRKQEEQYLFFCCDDVSSFGWSWFFLARYGGHLVLLVSLLLFSPTRRACVNCPSTY